MRMTREELKVKYASSWNEKAHDIVRTMYGDDPLVVYDDVEHSRHLYWVGRGLGNLSAVDDYIFCLNGKYNKYVTLIGTVYIDKDDNVLCGDISLKYNGKSYNIILNQMYGWNKLDILRIGQKVVGFSNSEGQGSPSNKWNTEELDKYIIEKLWSRDTSDYGESVNKFLKACKELYYKDTTNHIMEKCFNLGR